MELLTYNRTARCIECTTIQYCAWLSKMFRAWSCAPRRQLVFWVALWHRDWLCAALWRKNVESVLPKSLKEASHMVSPVMRPNWHAHIARCRTCHAGFRVWHWWLPPRVLDTQGQRGTWSYKPRNVYVAHMRCFWQCISERWDMMIYEILNKHKHSISNCVCSTHITRPPSRWPILVNNLGLALPRHTKPGRLLPQGVKIAIRRFQKRSDLRVHCSSSLLKTYGSVPWRMDLACCR